MQSTRPSTSKKPRCR